MTKPKVRKKYFGPESKAYKGFEGHNVIITFSLDAPEDSLRCRILWVDQYTIGIRENDSGRERMLYKDHIFTIELDTGAWLPAVRKSRSDILPV